MLLLRGNKRLLGVRSRAVNVEYVKPVVDIKTSSPKSFPSQGLAPPLLAKNTVDVFYDDLRSGKIIEARINRDKKIIKYDAVDKNDLVISVPITNSLIDEMINNDVQVRFDDSSEALFNSLVNFLIQNIFSIFFLGLFAYSIFMSRDMVSRQSKLFGGKAKDQVNPEDVKVKFEDVAGLENAKLELMEIVEFLKNPEKFTAVGAKIPKGCLLTGGPGLGKTLLAKAIAGEAGVPFFASSASEFIELFVGMGASRIRELFKKANAVAPCIIFIDEIDAIGKSRASGSMMAANDEREQTINQLLTEMDGFAENSGVVVIAATNRADILDKALVRPGRFDRQITVEPPTLNDREAILKIHCKSKPLDPLVSLLDIAKRTVGLSGAELANIANEAAILTARRSGTQLSMEDFMSAIDRVLLGPEKKNSLISEKKKRIVACHEAGHTITALKVGEYDTISKVSIIPRGKTGGVTMFEQLPDHVDGGMYSRKYLENKLVVALGGRAAEEIVFGESNITTGASGDMEVVQQLARAMIVNYGFSEKMGPVSWGGENSISTQNIIDKEVLELVNASYKRAKNILDNNYDLFAALTEALYNKEVLTREEISEIAQKYK
jgi:cell division protease FtsH